MVAVSNAVVVELQSAAHLASRRAGVQPAPYAVFSLFHSEDYTTATVPASNNPEFAYRTEVPVTMTPDLEAYLRTGALEVVILDDDDDGADTDTSANGPIAACLGVATIPLVALAQGNEIYGDFPVVSEAGGHRAGTLRARLSWVHPYEVRLRTAVSGTDDHPAVVPPPALSSGYAAGLIRVCYGDALVVLRGWTHAHVF